MTSWGNCRFKKLCKLGEFAGWEGGQSVARPRSSVASRLSLATRNQSAWRTTDSIPAVHCWDKKRTRFSPILTTLWSAVASAARHRFGCVWQEANPKRRRRFALPAHSIEVTVRNQCAVNFLALLRSYGRRKDTAFRQHTRRSADFEPCRSSGHER